MFHRENRNFIYWLAFIWLCRCAWGRRLTDGSRFHCTQPDNRLSNSNRFYVYFAAVVVVFFCFSVASKRTHFPWIAFFAQPKTNFNVYFGWVCIVMDADTAFARSQPTVLVNHYSWAIAENSNTDKNRMAYILYYYIFFLLCFIQCIMCTNECGIFSVRCLFFY